ncbi:MAG: hypothetical protein AAB677_01430 [Patescibacteria group bacterium]
MIIAIASILIITFAVWLIGEKLSLKICPICAGVSLTWFWLWLGWQLEKLPVADYQLPTAILMGGTVVGLMAKLESVIKPKFVLFWKTIFVVSGFSAVSGLLAGNWLAVAAGIILAAVTTLGCQARATEPEKQNSKIAEDLKEKMKNCC